MKTEIRCSICKGVTQKGALGAYGLRDNKAVVNLVSEMNSLDSSGDLCNCCNENPAEKICFGCHAMGFKLCEDCCMIEHSRPFAPVQSHKPLNIDEVRKVPKKFCAEHKQQLTHYSEKTDKYACQGCLDEQMESDAGFLEIDKVTQKLKQNLPSLMEVLEGYSRRLQDSQNKMITMQNKLRETKSKAMQDVLLKFLKYKNISNERQKTLLANLESEVSNITIHFLMNAT